MFTTISTAVICALFIAGDFVTFAQFESQKAATDAFRTFVAQGRVALASEGRALADEDIGIIELRCRAQ